MSTLSKLSENARTDFGLFTTNYLFLTPSFEKWLMPLLSTFEDDVSEEEREQVEKSRHEIAAGKAKRYKNSAEYLKSLDEQPK